MSGKPMLSSQAPVEAPGPIPPPLFYESIAIVRAEEHARRGLSTAVDCGFARSANAIPLTIAEFASAGLHYPIVFSAGTSPSPVAVVGLHTGANLFVERWSPAAGARCAPRYIPAYVRRYPFIIVEQWPGADQLLGLDLASARLAEIGAPEVEPLFDADGAPSAMTRSAVDFCRDYHRLHLLTEAFMRAMTAAGVLAPRSTTIRFADRRRHAVDGFQVIDEAALAALAPEVIADWHRRGWLALVTLHLASQQNWSALVDLQEAADRANVA